jgi:hypothetical protein
LLKLERIVKYLQKSMTSAIAVEKKKLEKPPLALQFLGARVLRQPAKRIAKVDQSIRNLVREMLQTMYSENGIGLAAPQIGKSLRLCVIKLDGRTHILINPEIKSRIRGRCEISCELIAWVFPFSNLLPPWQSRVCEWRSADVLCDLPRIHVWKSEHKLL